MSETKCPLCGDELREAFPYKSRAWCANLDCIISHHPLEKDLIAAIHALKADNERLESESRKMTNEAIEHTHDVAVKNDILQAENERLRKALHAVQDYQTPMGSSFTYWYEAICDIARKALEADK